VVAFLLVNIEMCKCSDLHTDILVSIKFRYTIAGVIRKIRDGTVNSVRYVKCARSADSIDGIVTTLQAGGPGFDSR
jgi:hypothetical protein